MPQIPHLIIQFLPFFPFFFSEADTCMCGQYCGSPLHWEGHPLGMQNCPPAMYSHDLCEIFQLVFCNYPVPYYSTHLACKVVVKSVSKVSEWAPSHLVAVVTEVVALLHVPGSVRVATERETLDISMVVPTF